MSWYFGYIPQWAVDYFNHKSHTDIYSKGHQPVGNIESTGEKCRGKYYEYMEVVIINHTHTDSIVKRKLRRRN